LRFGHFLRDDLYLDVLPAEQRGDLESYVLFNIPLPTDNPRLSMLMRDAREIVRDNFTYPPFFRDMFTKQQFENPQFWQEFADDMRTLDGVVRFEDFLKHFGGKYWNNKFDQWTAPSGKYANIYRFLENNRKQGVTRRDKNYQKKWAEPLFAYAPKELKSELAAFIEKDTKLGIEGSLLAYGFPGVLLPAVKRFGNLREDIAPEVLREVAGISWICSV
ncbi:MAG: hypothetical protein HYT27_02570, partial [Parcubacteria group bacterium]|nr:hypothetical protein [Parcubacteria group bacterium]